MLKNLGNDDKVVTEITTTNGYFDGGVGTLAGTNGGTYMYVFISISNLLFFFSYEILYLTIFFWNIFPKCMLFARFGVNKLDLRMN